MPNIPESPLALLPRVISQGEAQARALAQDADTLQRGVFRMKTRRFGSLAEIMVRRLTGTAKGRSQHHDLYDDAAGHRVEVKFSTVSKKNQYAVTEDTLFAALAEELDGDRILPFSGWSVQPFDSNIQQIKRAEFDILYYGLFFADTVLIFQAASQQVLEMPGYSDKQHKGNEGEGQFHLNGNTLGYHLEHHLHLRLSYVDLALLLRPPSSA